MRNALLPVITIAGIVLAAAAWAGVIFVLLAAPVWGTFLDTLKQAYTGYNAVSAYQIQPSLLLGAFDEAFYRPLMPNLWTFDPSANFLLLLGVLYFLVTLRKKTRHKVERFPGLFDHDAVERSRTLRDSLCPSRRVQRIKSKRFANRRAGSLSAHRLPAYIDTKNKRPLAGA